MGWGQLASVPVPRGFANVSGLLGAAGRLCSAGQSREGLYVGSAVGTSYLATQGSRENVPEVPVAAARLLMT